MAKLTEKFQEPQKPDNADRPPLIEDELMKVLGRFMAHKSLPVFMPPVPIDAARWWIDQQELPKPEDRPRQVSVVGDEGVRWICPYHQRLCYTLAKFLTIPTADQRIILAAREENIFWRGDEMYFFMMVIDETQKMRKMGVAAYREEALKKMKTFMGHHVPTA